MKLTSEQQKKIQDKLDKLDIHCAICAKNNFTLVDKIYELREFNEGNLVIGGANASVLPLIILVCVNCGSMVNLSAVILGIFDTEEKKVNNGQDNGTK